MTKRPNILFLMTDQMQGRVLDPDSPCRTPCFDRLAARGVRISNAYTPNAVCSPARASLMTGMLPHNHGVLEVTHCTDDDQCNLRTDLPHWAQRLAEGGYRTGYFGKWHVERSEDLARFGWQVDGGGESARFREHRQRLLAGEPGEPEYSLSRTNNLPPGYPKSLLYGVTDRPAARRGMGVTTDLALEFLEESVGGDAPWCCFVSTTEPHDPFIAGTEAFAQYDLDAIPLPPNVHDPLDGRPGLYRKAGRTWADMTDRERREAAACYYASITEIDGQYGRLIGLLEERGALDNTIVVLTSDHGELLGAHGLYCKNVSGFEEVYQIPMVVAGPGIAEGEETAARVGLHDLCPTLLELAGLKPFGDPDSRSFVALLRDPAGQSDDFVSGYAEYHGTRYRITQRVVWEGSWKLVFNGFDFDELYNLDEDPYELQNLADDPAHQERLRDLVDRLWGRLRDTKDHALLNAHYPILRLAPYGPAAPGERGE